MKKSISIISVLLLVMIVSVFSGCDLFGKKVNVTVSYIGTDYGVGGDLYLAVAKGSFSFSVTKPTSGDVVDQIKIAPSGTTQTHVFEVAAKENYTVFLYADANSNARYDSDETVYSNLSGLIGYIEEDEEVTIYYNY